jgi:hypothetical protein
MVTGRKADTGGAAAIREGSLQRGSRSEGCGDAGNYLEGDASGTERVHFLTSTAKDERVAGFEANDGETATGIVDHHGVDLFLGNVFVSAAFADVDHDGPRSVLQHGRGDKIVVEDDIGTGKKAYGLEGEQFGIAGTGADEVDSSWKGSRHADTSVC